MKYIFYLSLFLVPLYSLLVLYKPFSIYKKNSPNEKCRFQYISNDILSKLFPLNYIKFSKAITLNNFTKYTQHHVNNSPYIYNSLYTPPSYTLSNDFFNQPHFPDQNFTYIQKDYITLISNRQSFSTFGTSFISPDLQKKPRHYNFHVYLIGDIESSFTGQLPFEYDHILKEKLREPLEFFFVIDNNFILCQPTNAKSSGHEYVDDVISSYLTKSISSMGLKDGYYRFTLDP